MDSHNETKIPIVTVDIAFWDRWMKLILGTKSPFNFLGFWHPLHHLQKSSWKFWRCFTQPLFKLLYPDDEWREEPKGTKITKFFSRLANAATQFFKKNSSWFDSIDWTASKNRRLFFLFFRFHLPVIFRYKAALHSNDFSQLISYLRLFSLIFFICNNKSYARSTHLQTLLLMDWKTRRLPIGDILSASLHSFNEEQGEMALSVCRVNNYLIRK